MWTLAQLLVVAALLGFLYWRRDRRVAAQLQLGRIPGSVTDTGQLVGRLRQTGRPQPRRVALAGHHRRVAAARDRIARLGFFRAARWNADDSTPAG